MKSYYEAKLKSQQEEIDSLKSTVGSFEKYFNQDQMKKLKDPDKYLRWLPETIQSSLKMYLKLGGRGYEDLCESIPAYPNVRTLRRHIQNLDCSPGFQHDFLKLLKIKASKMNPQEKVE